MILSLVSLFDVQQYLYLYLGIAKSGQQQANHFGETWIGFYTDKDDASDFRWSDGSPVNYTNWASGEPGSTINLKCVQLAADPFTGSITVFNYHFFIEPCGDSVRNYVCKKPAKVVNVV